MSVLDGLDFLVHQRLDLMRARIADDDDAAVVADEMRQVVVLEHGRKGLEDRRFLRIVDMRLDLAARLRAQFAHQAVQHAERFEIVLFLRHRLLERLENGLAGILDRLHRIGDEEGAERGAADDHGFPRLHQHVKMAAHGHEAAKDAAERHHKSDQNAHDRSFRISRQDQSITPVPCVRLVELYRVNRARRRVLPTGDEVCTGGSKHR